MEGKTSPVVLVVGLLVLGLAVPGWAAERVKISYMFWSQTTSAVEEMKAAFEQANPGIEVELLHQPSGYKEKLRVMFAAGTAPDTYALDHQDIVEFTRLGWAVDLTSFIERTPDFRVNEFLPPVRDLATVDGMLVGFPSGVGTNMYYFNVKLFSEAGLETPDVLYARDAWTWAAFQDAARKLTRRSADGSVETWGAAVHLGGALPRGFIWSNGGDEVDDVKNPTAVLLDRPEAIEALDYLQRLLWSDETAMREGNPTDWFIGGNLGMYARWNSAFPLHADAPFEWGIVPYPKGPGPRGAVAADLTAAITAMAPTTPHREEAWRWISFFSSYEGNLIGLRNNGGIPSRMAFSQQEVAEFQPANLINPELLFLPLQIGRSRIMSPNQADILRAINQELNKIFRNEAPAHVAAVAATQLANAVIAGAAR